MENFKNSYNNSKSRLPVNQKFIFTLVTGEDSIIMLVTFLIISCQFFVSGWQGGWAGEGEGETGSRGKEIES